MGYLLWASCFIHLGLAIYIRRSLDRNWKGYPFFKEQIIQSLEGGILTKLNVNEGEIVDKGQNLAQLDPTRFASNVGESKSLLLSAKATAARLSAEVNGTALVFPKKY